MAQYGVVWFYWGKSFIWHGSVRLGRAVSGEVGYGVALRGHVGFGWVRHGFIGGKVFFGAAGLG